MFQKMMLEEANINANAGDEEHLKITACLFGL
jgi:hypothetical protein